ncbi:MAG: UPF0182 family protein [Dehalococcoidia bacterium]|nr:UPF0182 family protein [Dehalococcoidia bacterium]
MQDAYTTSNRYPYSEPIDSGINYIRNSVKIVINAYDSMDCTPIIGQKGVGGSGGIPPFYFLS